MHHGDGGGPDRLGFELGEGVAQRQAEVLLHPLAHVGERHGRPGVEAGPELVGHVVAEHARRRGDDLAELHEGPAQVLEALAQRPGQLRRRQRALADGAAAGGSAVGREVDRHHLGDGPAAPQQLAARRVRQPPRVDPRHVLGQRARHRGPTLCLHPVCRANRCVRRAWGHGVRVGEAPPRPPIAWPSRYEKALSSAASAPL